MSREFVGRARELAVVEAALDVMASGRGRLLLLAGEAGIGKTRLAAEAAARAVARGASVCWGRCWEAGGAPPFSPWMQVVRAAAALAADDTRRRAAPALGRLVPDLRGLLGPGVDDADRPEGSEPARFAMFDAVSAFLLDVASTRSLVVVLDDLHAADQPSLLLLQFLARELRDAPLVVLGTWRDVETRATSHAHMLGELARDGELLPLTGLAPEETARLVAGMAGERPDAVTVASLQRITGGNPFFVDEVVRVLRAEGGLARPWSVVGDRPLVPDRVRAVVRRRLASLSAAAIELLSVAAVLGQDVDLALFQRALGRPADRLLAVLDECLAADLFTPASGAIGSYRFAHALIRETLYDDLTPERRARLHARAAEVIEATGLPHQEAALATHLARALPYVDASRFVQAAIAAGRRAMDQLAFEEALAWFTRALDGLDGDDEARADLELSIADAARASGDGVCADAALERAAVLARGVGSASRLVRAILSLTPDVSAIAPDHGRLDLMAAALAALGPADDPLCAKLLARMAFELYWVKSREERAFISDRAIAMARRFDDPSALAYALSYRRFALWEPTAADDRRETTAELVRLCAATGDRTTALEANLWQLIDLLEAGDVAAADRVIAEHARMAEATRLPRALWWLALWRAMRLLLDGRFAEAEPAIAAALAAGERVHAGNARLAMLGQTFLLRWQTGRLGDLSLLGADTPMPANPIGMACGRVFLLAELGWVDETRAAFEAVAADDFAELRPYLGSLNDLQALTEACVFLGDAERAARLFARLEPYASRVIVSGPAVVCMGPVSRLLGMLAGTMRRFIEAEGWFAAALVQSMRMGSRPSVVRTQYDWARVLLARDEQGDRDRVRVMTGEALATARALGMAGLVTKLDAMRTQAGGGAHENVFRLDGVEWELVHGGRRVRLRDMAGLRYLATLLRRPHASVHVLELLAVAPGGLHVQRDRLDSLNDQIDEAERTNDAERAGALLEQRRRLLAELARDAGVGRAGRRGSPAERARVNVTRAIQAAIERIATQHPALAEHLHRTVRRGTFCSYEPDPRAPIAWSA